MNRKTSLKIEYLQNLVNKLKLEGKIIKITAIRTLTILIKKIVKKQKIDNAQSPNPLSDTWCATFSRLTVEIYFATKFTLTERPASTATGMVLTDT